MFLERILKTKRQEVAGLQIKTSLNQLEKMAAAIPMCRGFEQALRNGRKINGLGLIAEVKKASPSKGLIRENFHPVTLAQSYERAGAHCLSVLTDETYFQGKAEYLQRIKQEVGLPILRKDFVIDPYQVYESKVLGADAVLLIAAALDKPIMEICFREAKALGLDVLIEIHNREQLEEILNLNHSLIGINNRNLHTFETSLQTTKDLIPLLPDDIFVISESGIHSGEDLKFVLSAGAGGVLIGEYFMRQENVEKAVKKLMQALLSV
ncbi:indole-3-glycerol phosphate synthase TrpC [Paenibacillus larvae subsp. larvae]|uniref:Indole-3-glycerol phosphate synthase n=2 Tax=Paenibacillus larvae TaxID=1464 RepID=A0A1U9YR39_9BACL|nr:indole-3-glycerol phosphate synthase TrpC [Paenibacillus larvae]AQT86260.1 indole-3-glycerol phosphate synthase [Paenibacillus larvae subsp. pulvifaciens]AQZ47896.1 indole-3-glycerol phosphate synthase [Paenibacillus larvae subsp. pulvifaciens]ARF69652.1 indole-3-glycerol phosphate synthase [Paenibacillus larvae subsp. pulvifaciens]AVF25792.1 indole-3-glycerol phosphate synthase TrpC [Paenibacillus larvae subsp. larvae]AVF30569.1 indole-3-glycerol phosphate synthase TrpC [Paenibacillus larv